jgi:hypothetical protein
MIETRIVERCLACEAEGVATLEGSRFGMCAMGRLVISIACAAETCGNRRLPRMTQRDLFHSGSVDEFSFANL